MSLSLICRRDRGRGQASGGNPLPECLIARLKERAEQKEMATDNGESSAEDGNGESKMKAKVGRRQRHERAWSVGAMGGGGGDGCDGATSAGGAASKAWDNKLARAIAFML
ncbi:hypothetical protein E4U55_004373 [Claviceps digitariae]|nr:hypothetical protein E4U55_004373 [Claviceps digitariae]